MKLSYPLFHSVAFSGSLSGTLATFGTFSINLSKTSGKNVLEKPEENFRVELSDPWDFRVSFWALSWLFQAISGTLRQSWTLSGYL